MSVRYFNWKLAIVLVIGLVVLAVGAFALRQWRRADRADQGLELGHRISDFAPIRCGQRVFESVVDEPRRARIRLAVFRVSRFRLAGRVSREVERYKFHIINIFRNND